MKPIEFWIALGAGVLFVLERHKDKTLLGKITIAAISGGLGYSLANDFSLLTGWGEPILAAVITAVAYAALDIFLSILSDRELIVDNLNKFISKIIGGNGKKK